MNLAAIIEPHPDDAPALISRGEVTTYGTLRQQVAGLRGGLVGLGVDPGDRVAILCANNWYFVVSYLAVLGAGGVAVPLNPLSPGRELERELAAVAERRDVPFLPIFEWCRGCRAWTEGAAKNDGTHPDGSGYAALAGYVLDWRPFRRWMGLDPGP